MSSIAYGFVAWPACNPNLSKVGAAARNAQCETDNSNSDRSEGSRRGAVVTPEAHEMPLCLVPSRHFQVCFCSISRRSSVRLQCPKTCTKADIHHTAQSLRAI